MTSKMVQPLHIADSLNTLLRISEIKIPDLSLSACLQKMKKLHDSARKASLEKDQEQEFMFLHRYLMLLKMACKYPEYTKFSSQYRSDFSCAQSNMEKYELLHSILKKRYEENKEKDSRQKNNKIIPVKSISPTQEKSLKDLNNSIAAGKFNKTFIYSGELYNLLSTQNNKESLLLIDARSKQDFKESHLNGSNIINIPEEIIAPGMSASILNSKLEGNAKSQWEKRGTFDKLIIFDWNSSEADLKSHVKLYHLKKAMTEWDPGTQYKCLPLVLDGGYEDMLFKYPHMTSNPKVQPPLPNNINSLLSLDSFDYPIQELEPEVEKKLPVKEPQKTLQPEKTLSEKSPHELIVDRSTKPIITTPAPQVSDVSLDSTEIVSQESNTESSTSPEEDSTPSEINEVTPKEETEEKPTVNETKSVLDELRKIKPSLDASIHPETRETVNVAEVDLKIKPEHGSNQRPTAEKPVVEGTYKIPLKKDDGPPSSILKRSSSSPNIAKLDDEGISRIPSFTRANKPVAYAERADSTYGKTVAGLTGLKNFANNCYMNSILQCLSNTDPLVKELISINRPVATNPQSKTKGRVAQEVITAFRNMWSGDVRVYSIKDLKTLLGSLKEIFKGTGHQDSNEFLIILLEYLHDDLNIPASGESRLDGAREDTGEKAWGEFRRKNCSIIQRLFYGQHRSTVTCSTCQHQSVTFEQFFNLFVPIPSRESVSLSDCIQLYMSGEKISGWKCPKCKDERNATKKFDISRLPPILVIALKRFTHEEDSWLQKKENLVTYPLEDLDMERFTIRGSEQRYKRYNLYAMSTHTGTLRAGHYKAICRNHVTNKWHMFDDQTVEALPAHSVRNNPEVYILFYNAVIENC
ncbi:ubiquitin carboxyl-terminal hydrolase 8 [Halyomorpha halys]|uniref:ubiquitin carboxyl-terminal hydrolase 8 n=1 Tax=Halyomorpha halys TaxID=286706 RepID=UPI0006D4E040|nr:ubiquitin carboxyl-terminal hydrolase 8 [Halyomorpha halys]